MGCLLRFYRKRKLNDSNFSLYGAKAKIRDWVVDKFPKEGYLYYEPFVGLANVYFLAKSTLNYNRWWVNDLYSHKFLYLVKNDPLEEILPEKVEDKFFYKQNRELPVSILLEQIITFGGKGYNAGFTNDININTRYNKERYLKRLLAAKELLKDAFLTCADSMILDYSAFTENDFLYFDPPYYGTKPSYPNVDHEKLVEILNGLKCKWALSGYDNELYKNKLNFLNKYEKERNSEIKSSSEGKYSPVIEIIWTNY